MSFIVRITITAITVALSTPLLSFAQGGDDGFPIAEISAGNFFGIGARGLGMGGAQIAAGMDGTALVYNPALLARIRRIEILTGMSHDRLSNDGNSYPAWSVPDKAFDGKSKSFTRLNALDVSVPVPTYRGSAVVGFGVNRVMSFDHVFQFGHDWHMLDYSGTERGSELETGGLYLYSAGGAIDLSPRLSVGGALNLYHGRDNYTWDYYLHEQGTLSNQIESEEYSQYIESRYTGVSARVGMSANFNHNLLVGVTVESPISFAIDGEFSEDGWSYPDEFEYELRHPFSFGAGAALSIDRLLLALDLNYTDWRQMEYTEYANMAVANRLFDLYYRETVKLNIGAEYMLPRIGAKLRAGYVYDPIPYADFLVKNDRDFITIGAGFLIDKMMTLDIAFITGSYEYTLPDPSVGPIAGLSADAMFEKYSVNRLYVTTAFRL
jgi:long-chain fatty acid transport protein